MSLSAAASSFDPYSLPIVQPLVRQGFDETNVWYEQNVPACAVTAVRFDPYEEMLWTGTSDVCASKLAASNSQQRCAYLGVGQGGVIPDARRN